MNLKLNIVPAAVAFEAALGLVGFLLAAWLDVPLAPRLDVSGDALLRGVLGVAPMLTLLAVVTMAHSGPLADLRRQVEELVGKLFRDVSWVGLAAVSLAAGLGEELLFRGALQPWAERWLGPLTGLIAASLLFGAVHALSLAYFALATLVGLYLGLLAQHFDDLAAPIIVHSAYDLAALMVLQRSALRKRRIA